MSFFLSAVRGLFETFVSLLRRKPMPGPIATASTPIITSPPATGNGISLPTVAQMLELQVAKLIASQTMALGPLPGTQGVVHVVSSQTGAIEAHLIVRAAFAHRINNLRPEEVVALLCAFIRGESDFDPLAVNPNMNTIGIDHPTVDQVLENSDLGVGEVSFAVARAMPEFAGKTDEEIRDTVLQLAWGVEFMAVTVARNLNSNRFDDIKSKLIESIEVPSGNWPASIEASLYGKQYFVAYCTSYNSGETGTYGLIAKGLPLHYGYGVAARFLEYLPIVA